MLPTHGRIHTASIHRSLLHGDILPDSAACLDSLGWVYFKMGLIDESKKYLKMALDQDNTNPIIAEHLREVQKVEE